MSSDHPFDDHMKNTFDRFEPDVHANWNEFEQSLKSSSPATPSVAMKYTFGRWAVATAVVAGGALMWVVKPIVEQALTEDATVEGTSEPVGIQGDVQSFDEAWAEFTSISEGFAEDLMSVESIPEPSDESQFTQSESTAIESNLNESSMSSGMYETADDEIVGNEPEEERTNRLLAELPFDASLREACEGVEVSFNLSGLDRTMSFLWNFGDGHFSNDPAPRHTFTRPGTYDITLSVRPQGEGSISTRTIQNMITVLPKPEASFAWAFPSTVNGNRVRVQLKDLTPDATSSQWVINGEGSRKGLVQLEIPGVYPVHLVASNRHGCLDEAHHDITIGDRHGLLAQARFSPNGDGYYDTFLPHGLRDMDGTWEMVVVNRKGQEVYRTSNADEPWDGSLPDGDSVVDRATYTWTVRCLDSDGTPRLFTDRLRIEL